MGNYSSDQKNARFYGLKLSRTTDADIINQLDSQESIQGYIKELIRRDMKMITFEAGTARYDNYGVNFMKGPGELYAEIRVPENASEDYGYLTLKAEILRQAAENGIEGLTFPYDGQEQYLDEDASAT